MGVCCSDGAGGDCGRSRRSHDRSPQQSRDCKVRRPSIPPPEKIPPTHASNPSPRSRRGPRTLILRNSKNPGRLLPRSPRRTNREVVLKEKGRISETKERSRTMKGLETFRTKIEEKKPGQGVRLGSAARPPRLRPTSLEEPSGIFRSKAESLHRSRRWAVAKPIGKIGEQARRARPTQTVFNLVRPFPKFFFLQPLLTFEKISLCPFTLTHSSAKRPTKVERFCQ